MFIRTSLQNVFRANGLLLKIQKLVRTAVFSPYETCWRLRLQNLNHSLFYWFWIWKGLITQYVSKQKSKLSHLTVAYLHLHWNLFWIFGNLFWTLKPEFTYKNSHIDSTRANFWSYCSVLVANHFSSLCYHRPWT